MVSVLQNVTSPVLNRQGFLDQVFRLHSIELRYFLMRTVSEDDADDLLQEVYLRMVAHPDLATIENHRAFMYAMATNLLRDRWRRANARCAPVWVNMDDLDMLAGGSDPAEVTDWRQSLDRVGNELAHLTDKQRLAFELNRIGDLSYREISGLMAVSVSMVEKHISLALKRLHAVV